MFPARIRYKVSVGTNARTMNARTMSPAADTNRIRSRIYWPAACLSFPNITTKIVNSTAGKSPLKMSAAHTTGRMCHARAIIRPIASDATRPSHQDGFETVRKRTVRASIVVPGLGMKPLSTKYAMVA